MKKFIVFTAVFLSVFVLFCSCENGAGGRTAEVQELTDEEIKAKYWEAVTAYSWFETATISNDTESIHVKDGTNYYKVNHERISTMAELRTYLQTLFTDQTIDLLLTFEEGKEKFIEHEGLLYVNRSVRSSIGFRGAETLEVLRTNDKKTVNLIVSVELLDKDLKPYETKNYTFILSYADKQWRFTNFSLLR